MTTGNLFLDLWIAGVIGQLIHISCVKLPAMSKRAEAAQIEFSFMQFLKKDAFALVGAFLTIFAAVFVADEMLAKMPTVSGFIKTIFIFVGYAPSSVFMGAFSKYEKWIQCNVQENTKIAEEKKANNIEVS